MPLLQKADWGYHKRACNTFSTIVDLLPGLPVNCTQTRWWENRLAGLNAINIFIQTLGAEPFDPVRRNRHIACPVLTRGNVGGERDDSIRQAL